MYLIFHLLGLRFYYKSLGLPSNFGESLIASGILKELKISEDIGCCPCAKLIIGGNAKLRSCTSSVDR